MSPALLASALTSGCTIACFSAKALCSRVRVFCTIELTIAFMLWFLDLVDSNAVLPSQLKQRGSIGTMLSGEGLVFLVS